MQTSTARTHLVSLLGLLVFLGSRADAQVTPLGDSFTSTADPTTNYGAAVLRYVNGARNTTYIRFNLASIPPAVTISQATLKLYVNGVTTAGTFNVDYVGGAWSESTIDGTNAPPLGATIAADVSVTTGDKNQYILVNVTAAIEAWLSGSEANNGVALVANGAFDATFDSKENTTTSHPAELDIAFAGGDGTITGVTTATGSGLTGGGASGALSLSLTKACAANQILQWNGSAWACSNTGAGTITGVTAGRDLTGGGAGGNVTLNLNTTALNSVYPQLAAGNTFTGSQTVNGNLSATGTVSGSSFEIGSNLFGFGSYGNGNAFLGFAGNAAAAGSYNTASGALALQYITTGAENTATDYGALQVNSTASFNTATGYGALYENSGNFNTATGVQALYYNYSGAYNTATGADALKSNQTGNYNTANGYAALYSSATATSNTASGYEALFQDDMSSYNTATGYQALYAAVGTTLPNGSDTGDGYQALYANTTGYGNVASGDQALYSNTTGWDNVASGYQALYANTVGTLDTATGTSALVSNTTGYNNTAAGGAALNANTTGSNNTGVGVLALTGNTTGSDLTCIGSDCTTGSDGLSNATAIGAQARVDASNSLVLGGTGQYAVKVGIGTTTPSNVLSIAQGAGHPVSDSWETYSSRRWKTNIQPLHDALGKVEKLRGVSYDLKATGRHEIGVIAEEVGAVVPELVSYEANGKDARSVDYARLTASLIEAAKEQQQEIQRQQSLLRTQADSIRDLKSELRETRQSLQKIKAQMSSTQPAVVAEKMLWTRSPQATKP